MVEKMCGLSGPHVLQTSIINGKTVGQIKITHDYSVAGPNFEKAITMFSTAVTKAALSLEESPYCVFEGIVVDAVEGAQTIATGKVDTERRNQIWTIDQITANQRDFIQRMNEATTKLKTLEIRGCVMVTRPEDAQTTTEDGVDGSGLPVTLVFYCTTHRSTLIQQFWRVQFNRYTRQHPPVDSCQSDFAPQIYRHSTRK